MFPVFLRFLFFLALSSFRCVVLLIRDSRGAYYQSIYLDDHGEEDARECNAFVDEFHRKEGVG